MTNTTNNLRPNRYPGSCAACGGHVAAGQGHIIAKVNGRWTVGHNPCPGMVEPVGIIVTSYRYAGMTWNQVAEANEFWDGEDVPRAYARREWEAKSGMFCRRHGDSFAAGDDRCWECAMEADERQRDLEDGMISARKHGAR